MIALLGMGAIRWRKKKNGGKLYELLNRHFSSLMERKFSTDTSQKSIEH